MHFPALPSSSCGDDAASPLLLKRGERFLAPDVYRTCPDGREAVIKDYSATAAPRFADRAADGAP